MTLDRLGSGSQRRCAALAAAALGVVLLAGCGTPAVVKPAATPLPGLARDIRAAQGVVAQSQQQAQGLGSTGVTGP